MSLPYCWETHCANLREAVKMHRLYFRDVLWNIQTYDACTVRLEQRKGRLSVMWIHILAHQDPGKKPFNQKQSIDSKKVIKIKQLMRFTERRPCGQ